MTVYLCPVDPKDARPNEYSFAVTLEAVSHNADALYKWSRSQKYPECREWVIDAVTEAFVRCRNDIQEITKYMMHEHKWHCDHRIIGHLETIKKNIPKQALLAQKRWVLRTGIRFPGKKGDLVTFDNRVNHVKARVLFVNLATASAEVEAENGSKAEIGAETIITNHTNKRAGTRIQIGFTLPEPKASTG